MTILGFGLSKSFKTWQLNKFFSICKVNRWRHNRMNSLAYFILGFFTCFVLSYFLGSFSQVGKSGFSSPEEDTFLDNIKEGPLLVILVFSSVKNSERRQAIRETWAISIDKQPEVKFYFVISGAGLSIEDLKLIDLENGEHGDLLIFNHLEDSFHSLTAKVLVSFAWLSGESSKLGSLGLSNKDKNFQTFSYVLKCDDDSFVRVSDIVHELKYNVKHSLLYWGFFDGRAQVKRAGKYKELNWNICDTYLPYALGGGYVLSEQLVAFIGRNANSWKQFQSEDTSVGAWLATYEGIYRLHDPRFDTEYLSRGCHQSYLVTHKHAVDGLKLLHNNMKTTGNLCQKEYRTRLSYKYNWNGLPSKCCVRNNPNIP